MYWMTLDSQKSGSKSSQAFGIYLNAFLAKQSSFMEQDVVRAPEGAPEKVHVVEVNTIGPMTRYETQS